MIVIYKNVSLIGLFGIIIISSLIPVIQNLLLIYTQKIGDALGAKSNDEVIIFLFIQSIIYLLVQILILWNKMIENRLNPQYDFYLNNSIQKKLSKVRMYLLDDFETYNKIIMIQQIIPQIGVSFLMSLLTIIQTIIALVGMSYILSDLHWAIIGTLILFSIINIIVSHIFNRNQLKIYNDTSELTRKRDYFTQIFSSRELMAESRVFQLHEFFIGKWKELYWRVETPNIIINNKRSLLAFAIQISVNFVQLIALILLVRTSEPILSIGAYMVLTQAMLQLQGRANEFVASISHINQIFMFLPIYFEVLELEEEDNKKVEFTDLKKCISVKNLSFSYKNSDVLSLKNLNFTINKGESVAIVGYNGSGKTTLVKCLLGLYNEFDGGTIDYDNISINEYNKDSIRKNTAVLFQNYGKYPLSIKENILLGNLIKIEDTLLYDKALKLSGAWQFINKLNYKHDTMLHPEFEKGIDLSGGQWQKTALARMYFRNASILFLDEPTAAIDPISENNIYKQFFEIASGKTSIILTHRLGMCKWVDKIIVMEEGSIKEIGNHEQLLNNNSLYKEMYSSQAEWYTKTKNHII